MTKIELLQERLKKVQDQMKIIAGDFPVDVGEAIKFKNLNLERKQLTKDIKSCKSNNPDLMCSNCDCWKHVRHMCS